ncbi:GNAT family N-acetyltransferase [Mangrovactinospora gilvigrisea]|uniref:GNAT family N-acetyltransferase n=1 Tax=Mangrovactinospora gilvigrisea TaxID=1428644 RepID=A0A1J7BET7_9ACTN|nr:GNAT family N-acetyltransferase [Mangrovactinospora gilvigrisea]OIV37085.1 GNAT family N-acetyltransferase [Mangrovactinospora gilvigrisea]
MGADSDADVQRFAVANLRRRPEPVEVGGFVVGVDPATSNPFVNYATPLPGSEPDPGDVAGMVKAFRDRGLRPRLEFAPLAVPEVEAALRKAGFVVEEEHEVLLCVPESLAPPSGAAGIDVEVPEADADFRAVDAALSEAFDGEFPPSDEGVARLKRAQRSGGAVRFVRADDAVGCAGAGSCSAPAEGTAEIAGIGTRPAFRGRGIAAAVTAGLAAAMFAEGRARSVWLEYSGDGSRRVYERVGFRPAGRRLYMSLPDL